MINDQLKRELELFAKRWGIENELEKLERMVEVSDQLKNFTLTENNSNWLMLLDEYSDNYCLSSYDMLLEFMELVYQN